MSFLPHQPLWVRYCGVPERHLRIRGVRSIGIYGLVASFHLLLAECSFWLFSINQSQIIPNTIAFGEVCAKVDAGVRTSAVLLLCFPFFQAKGSRTLEQRTYLCAAGTVKEGSREVVDSLRVSTTVLQGRQVITSPVCMSFGTVQVYVPNPCRVQLVTHLWRLEGER